MQKQTAPKTLAALKLEITQAAHVPAIRKKLVAYLADLEAEMLTDCSTSEMRDELLMRYTGETGHIPLCAMTPQQLADEACTQHCIDSEEDYADEDQRLCLLGSLRYRGVLS